MRRAQDCHDAGTDTGVVPPTGPNRAPAPVVRSAPDVGADREVVLVEEAMRLYAEHHPGPCEECMSAVVSLVLDDEAETGKDDVATPSASDTELLEVAENALGQAGMMFDRIQKAAPAAIEKVDHLGPTLAVLRQAHDEIHNEVEHRKRSRDADTADVPPAVGATRNDRGRPERWNGSEWEDS